MLYYFFKKNNENKVILAKTDYDPDWIKADVKIVFIEFDKLIEKYKSEIGDVFMIGNIWTLDEVITIKDIRDNYLALR